MTELNLGKLMAEATRDLDKKWKEERKMDKEIKKNLKGLWLLWNDNSETPVVTPLYMTWQHPDGKYLVYGSRGYHNKRELTTEEHKKYYALLDKVKRANNSLNRWKQSLGGKHGK